MIDMNKREIRRLVKRYGRKVVSEMLQSTDKKPVQPVKKTG